MQQGEVPELLKHFLRYNTIIEESQSTNRIDLGNVTPSHPTCLLPLLISVRNNFPPKDIIMPKDAQAANLFRDVVGSAAGYIDLGSQIPFVVLPNSNLHLDPYFQRICDMGGAYCRKEKFRVMVDELTDNIYLHSHFKNAMVMAQHFPPSSHIELCIMDDGITIGGSLRNAGMMMEDDDALTAALKGLSSRKEVGRGFGLRESISILTTKYDGQVLLASGRAISHFDHDGPKGFLMRETLKLQGTLICIRLPGL